MSLDLSKYSGMDVLRVVGGQCPEFVDLLAQQIERGWSDDQIVRVCCDSGASPQAMRYAKKLLGVLRNLPPV